MNHPYCWISRRGTAGALGLALLSLFAIQSMGVDSPPDAHAVNALFPATPPAAIQKTTVTRKAQPGTEKNLGQMEERLDTIEARLGKTSRPPSVTYNVDRRLSDLERRIQKIEQQLTRMQKWEQRIRRLEMK